MNGFISRLYYRLLHHHYADDLGFALQLEARKDAVAYVKAHMQSAMICDDRLALHQLALEHASLQGLMLEFGVKRGATIRNIAALTAATVHGFDSFEGLPEDWAGTSMRKGKFSIRGALPKVPPNVVLHPGWFNETLPDFVRAQQGPVAFVHIDSDLYSSAQTIFETLGDWLIAGSVIVFDEYFNFPAWEQHEFKAFQEFVAAHRVHYDYLGFTRKGGSVVVKITARA